jgi:hypothetical protein
VNSANRLSAALAAAAVSIAAWAARLAAPITARPTRSAAVAPALAWPAESWLTVTTLRTTWSASMTETLLSSVTVRFPTSSAAARLTNREVWRLPFGRLTVRSGQGRADQAAMDRTIVIARLALVHGQWFRLLRFGGRLERGCCDRGVESVSDRFDRLRIEFGTQRAFHRLTGSTFGAFSTLRRNTCPFEFVVRLTGGAACLLDLIFDHGHDGMVGDAALARAVIVQNVTEPKPALLH